MAKASTRPCEVSSHQVYYKAWFHRWTDHNGKLHALVEGGDGNTKLVDMSYHSIKFLDGKPVP